MKKFILILILLLPTMLFAQQDSIKQTFKIGCPLSYLCDKRNDSIKLSCFYKCMHYAIICGKSNDSIKITSPHKIGEITAQNLPNYQITGFKMAIQWVESTGGLSASIPLSIANTGAVATSFNAPASQQQSPPLPCASNPPPTSIVAMVSYDANLTMEMIKAIENATLGSQVTFYDIICKLPDGTKTYMSELTLFIRK